MSNELTSSICSAICARRRKWNQVRRVTILKASRSCLVASWWWHKDLQAEDFLSHLLGPLPWTLSTADGQTRKTIKATWATTLHVEEGDSGRATPTQLQWDGSRWDGRNFVQRVNGDQVIDETQGRSWEWQNWRRVEHIQGEVMASQVHTVGGSEGGSWAQITTRPSLTTFWAGEWREPEYRQKPQRKALHATVNMTNKTESSLRTVRRCQFFSASRKKQKGAYVSWPCSEREGAIRR